MHNEELKQLPLEKPIQPPDYDIWFHLLLDVYDCKNLDNHKIIKDFFSELIEKTGMKPLNEPYIVSVDNDQGRGTTCLQAITTSSVTFHSDDKYYCAFIDFFSCQVFSPQVVIDLTKKYFNPKTIKAKFISRSED